MPNGPSEFRLKSLAQIGRLLISQIGISNGNLTKSGTFAGLYLPELPQEMVGEISRRVDISNIK